MRDVSAHSIGAAAATHSFLQIVSVSLYAVAAALRACQEREQSGPRIIFTTNSFTLTTIVCNYNSEKAARHARLSFQQPILFYFFFFFFHARIHRIDSFAPSFRFFMD
jgi:hypothetical protein